MLANMKMVQNMLILCSNVKNNSVKFQHEPNMYTNKFIRQKVLYTDESAI